MPLAITDTLIFPAGEYLPQNQGPSPSQNCWALTAEPSSIALMTNTQGLTRDLQLFLQGLIIFSLLTIIFTS